MTTNDNNASELIARFASDLFALTGGAPIPRRWKNMLAHALKPKRRKVGRKLNAERLRALAADVVNDITLAAPRSKGTEGKRRPAKQQLAQAHRTTQRAVERAQTALQHMLADQPLPADQRRALIEGVAEALQRRLDAADEAELKERQRKATRS